VDQKYSHLGSYLQCLNDFVNFLQYFTLILDRGFMYLNEGFLSSMKHPTLPCIGQCSVTICFPYFFVSLPLWSSGQSSWLQIQGSGFDSQCYQIFWEVVGQEWGPLSLVNTIEELLQRNSSDSGLEAREYGHRDPLHDTLYPQKLALTSPTSGGRSVGIVSLWTTDPHGHILGFWDRNKGNNKNKLSLKWNEQWQKSLVVKW
jgi:hypothetical protein